jgi:hypothetical protein
LKRPAAGIEGMAKERGSSRGVEFVFQLPATTLWELAAVLDPCSAWEDVGRWGGGVDWVVIV